MTIFAPMKFRLQHIAMLLVVWLVAACNPLDDYSVIVTRQGSALPSEAASPELAAIDSLMWQQPDSALTLLLPWFDTVRANGTFDNHYAHLLLSELLYKNDCAQANRVELQQAVTFFDSLLVNTDTRGVSQQPDLRRDAPRASAQNTTNAFFDARAHYINGVGYYEHDSVMQACQEYLTALEIMENRFEEKELVGDKARFMALIYTRLTDLFSDFYLHKQAIYFGKTALYYYKKHGSSAWHTAWTLNEIGSHYEMEDNYDSADYYYHRSLSVLTDNNNLIYRDVATHLAFLSYKKGGPAVNSLDQLQVLIKHSEDKTEKLSRCAIVGEIYYHEKQFDSAWYYLSKVFRESQSVNSKKQAAEWLVEICENEEKFHESEEYARFLVPFSTMNENQSHLKSQLTNLHQNYVQEKQEILHQKKIKENHAIVNRVVGFLLGIVVVVVVLYVVNKKRHLRLQDRHEKMGRQLESERHSHKMQQAALSGRLRESNNSLRLQSEKIIQLQKAMVDKEKFAPYYGDYELFVQEEPCKRIIKSLEGTNIKRISVPNDYPELILSSAQLLGLAMATEKHFQGFEDYLRRLYPRISALDLDICRLFLLGVNEKQASILLHRDYSTLMEHVRKMKRAFQTEGSLRDFIRNGK